MFFFSSNLLKSTKLWVTGQLSDCTFDRVTIFRFEAEVDVLDGIDRYFTQKISTQANLNAKRFFLRALCRKPFSPQDMMDNFVFDQRG